MLGKQHKQNKPKNKYYGMNFIRKMEQKNIVVVFVCVRMFSFLLLLYDVVVVVVVALNTYDRSTNACCSCSLNLKLSTRTYFFVMCVFLYIFSAMFLKQTKFLLDSFQKMPRGDLFNAILFG